MTRSATNLARAFYEAAQASPDREALVLPDETVSYGELARRAAAISSALEFGAHERTAILASRSAVAYAGVLGVLAAGHAYVPLNPSFPAARNLAILEKAGVSTLVVGAEAAAALAELLRLVRKPLRVIVLKDHEPSGLSTLLQLARFHTVDASLAAPPEPARVSSDAPAYVMFTSGSTGSPKGVVVTHANVQRYVESFLSLYPIVPEDRLTQTFDLTFDLSVHDQFVCWAARATLVVYPAAALGSPLELTRQARVSVWFSVPSAIAHLESSRKLDDIGLPDLRLSLFCGEKFSFNAWKLWRRVAPNSHIVNLYGPTETTIAITHFEVPPDLPETAAPQGVVPIGKPFPGQGAEIRRDDDSPADMGEIGALWLCGDQLSAGYLNEPALTAERFVAREGKLFYRTGDRGRVAPEACLTFFGREDLQVKIMGYRVELGEVEHALRRVSASAEAVALVIERDGLEELCAVLPLSQESGKKGLRKALETLLPSYMRPRRYCFVPSFPVNASGKIDRQALARALVGGEMR